MLGRRILRTIQGPKKQNVTGGWRNCLKGRGALNWVEDVARTEETRIQEPRNAKICGRKS